MVDVLTLGDFDAAIELLRMKLSDTRIRPSEPTKNKRCVCCMA